jgi:hypothetical protein
MKIDAREFMAYLQSKLRPPIPIEFENKESRFAPFWTDFVSFISSYLEALEGRALADNHNYYLYHFPAVAVVPRREMYVVFSKSSDLDDLYLGYNTAYVFAKMGLYYYIVPYISKKAVDKLVNKNINPAVLEELMYTLPMLASMPCTSLIGEVPLVRDYMIIKAQSYVTSSDVATAMFGYTLLRLLSTNATSYEKVYTILLKFVEQFLIKKGFHVEKTVHAIAFLDTPIKLQVLKII